MSLYYFQTNIICILILLIINFSLRSRKNTMPARRIAFSKLLLAVGVVCVSDIFAWYYNGQDLHEARAILQVSNIVYDAAITWTGYAWLNYVELRIRSLDYDYGKGRFLRLLPLLIMLVMLVTNPLTDLMFTIDENNVYARGDGIFFHWIISWFYLLCATAEVIAAIKRAKSRAEKEQFIPMLWFIVPPAIAAVLQMFVYGITSTQCGMTLAALIIATNYMVDEVSTDTLTGLNNRRALENTVIELLQKTNSRLTVLMCDIDKFKSINDTLGHTAGDLVLKRMAEVLKSVCNEQSGNLFLCRYGGDEFVICGTDMKESEITELISAIQNKIEAVNTGFSSENKFSISVGQATGICLSYEDVEALISMADAMMYENKQAKLKA